ncbi:hypothetical protein [Caudoviricetes sp.]|nr:hypothetical protein [Caudoviricetes sp.]
MSAYTENQARILATAGGQMMAAAEPGDLFVTELGDLVCLAMAWRPDLDGGAEKSAIKYKLPFSSEHNSEIAYSGARNLRVRVIDCGRWRKVMSNA